MKWSRSRSWLTRCPLGVLPLLPNPALFGVTQTNNPPGFCKCRAGRSVLSCKVVLVICIWRISCSQVYGDAFKPLELHCTHSYSWVLHLVPERSTGSILPRCSGLFLNYGSRELGKTWAKLEAKVLSFAVCYLGSYLVFQFLGVYARFPPKELLGDD